MTNYLQILSALKDYIAYYYLNIADFNEKVKLEFGKEQLAILNKLLAKELIDQGGN